MPNTNTAEETKTNEALEFVAQCLYKNTNIHSFSNRWSNISFTESGACRMMSIVGYIVAMVHFGKVEEAESYANELVELFDRLNATNQVKHPTIAHDGSPNEITIPDGKVVIADDANLHSFSFARYFYSPGDGWKQYHEIKDAIDKGELEPRAGWFFEDKPTYAGALYKYSYNGGIIFHGPGQGETFTVDIGSGDNLWGIHT